MQKTAKSSRSIRLWERLRVRSPLVIGELYSRVEVQEAIGVHAPTHKGAWGTGYTEFGGEFFVFANVGTAGRTGHDYRNEWDGNLLHWSAKTGTHATQPAILRLLEPGRRCHIFTRRGDRDRFTYHGKGRPTNVRGSHPIRLTWIFGSTSSVSALESPTAEARERDITGRQTPFHVDYRSVPPVHLGEDTSAVLTAAQVLKQNAALLERALNGHRSTQNALAERVRSRGLHPLSPAGPVDYDLAWWESDGITVAEVKSLTDVNEVAQLRLGIGQLLDYAAALEGSGDKVARLVLALERAPAAGTHWMRVCARAGILLAWAPGFEGLW